MFLDLEHPCHRNTTAPKSKWATTPTTMTMTTPPTTYYMIVGTNIQKGAQRGIMMDGTCKAIEPLFSYGEKFYLYHHEIRFRSCAWRSPHEFDHWEEGRSVPVDALLFGTRQDAEEFIETLKKEHHWEFQPDPNAWVVMEVVPTYAPVINGFKIVTEQN